MRRKTKGVLTLGAILALGMLCGRPARAAVTPNAELDLQVTFSAYLSVKVNGLNGSTETLRGYTSATAADTANNPGASDYAAPVESATVTNDGGSTARWQLSVATTSGGANWTLNNATGSTHANAAAVSGVTGHLGCSAGCPAAEQYGFQAIFVSSNAATGNYGTNNCPAVNASDWDTSITTVPATAVNQAQSGVSTYLGGAIGLRQFADGATTNAGAGLGGNGLPDSDVTGSSPALTGQANSGDMLPLNNQIPGTGKRGLCIRMTMPSTTVNQTQQTIRLLITAIIG